MINKQIDQLQGSARERLIRIGACFGTQATQAAQRLLPVLRDRGAVLAAYGFTSGAYAQLEALLSLSAAQPRERAILHAMRRDMCEACSRCVREALALEEGGEGLDLDPAALWPHLDELAGRLEAAQDDARAAQARALSQTLRAHLRERAKMRELPAAVERWDMIEGAIFDLLRAAERAASEAQAAQGADLELEALVGCWARRSDAGSS